MVEARGNYEGKVIFKHVQIRLVASNKPLMGCGPLPDLLRKKLCIYPIARLMITFAPGGALPYTSEKIYKGALNLLLGTS